MSEEKQEEIIDFSDFIAGYVAPDLLENSSLVLNIDTHWFKPTPKSKMKTQRSFRFYDDYEIVVHSDENHWKITCKCYMSGMAYDIIYQGILTAKTWETIKQKINEAKSEVPF